MAALAALLASVPLAFGALVAARPFARAAVRCRVLTAGFAAAAAVGPLGFLIAAHREAPQAPGGAPAPAFLTPAGLPLLALAAGIAAVLILELVCDVVKLRRVKRAAEPLGSLDVRRARLGTSRTVATPTAVGYFHPAVLLPENFRARVDEREWDAVVAHECAHLARGDDWAKALQSAVTRLGWWLPGLWILGRALDLERELASDERAAGATGARRYAACLLRLATDRCTGTLAPAFGARRSHVAIGVERLLRPVRPAAPVLRAAALGAFTAAALAIVAAAVLIVPGSAARRVAAVPQAGTTVPEATRTATRPHPAVRVALGKRRHAPPPHRRAATTLAFVPAVRSRPAVPAPQRAPFAPLAARASAPRPPAARPPAGRSAGAAPVVIAAAGPLLGRASAVRADTSPAETIAFVAPGRRCRTCFGPLRSADDAVSLPVPSRTVSPALPTASIAAVTTEPQPAGAVSVHAELIWFRATTHALMIPY